MFDAGLVIRRAVPGDAAAIAGVQVASWRSTYRGMVAEATLAALREDVLRQRMETQQAFTTTEMFVAENDGRLVGFACGGPARSPSGAYADYDAELYAIYLLEAYQGRGIGRGLVLAAAAALGAKGYKKLMVWVLEANPAMGFYQRLGAVELMRSTVEIGEQELPEIALGWASVDDLPRAYDNDKT